MDSDLLQVCTNELNKDSGMCRPESQNKMGSPLSFQSLYWSYLRCKNGWKKFFCGNKQQSGFTPMYGPSEMLWRKFSTITFKMYAYA